MRSPPSDGLQRYIDQATDDLRLNQLEVSRLAEVYANAKVAADDEPDNVTVADACRAAWDALLNAAENRNRSQVFLDDLSKPHPEGE